MSLRYLARRNFYPRAYWFGEFAAWARGL